MSRDEVRDICILCTIILFERGVNSDFQYTVAADAC
jgi:hypothetical protein